jgi:hypothetical protein
MKYFTEISPPVISRRAHYHKEMLTSALMWMNEELDRYIGITKNVPWFYNERAVLGFFISGLIRCGDAVVLQEFSCYKGNKLKQSNIIGRSDLYFILRDEDYLVESKWCRTSANERSDFSNAMKWATDALHQANLYRKDAEVKENNVFSLCFEAIYCTNKSKSDYAEIIKEWRVTQANDLAGLDFYSLIEVTSEARKDWYRCDNLLFPALAVYGLFNCCR